MKNMHKFIILLLAFLIGINSAFAYTLVLPKDKKTVLNKEHAFFVGKAQNTEVITINDKRIYIAPN